MTDIMPFDFDGAQVRVVVDLEGAPWWVASDVCSVLDIADTSRAVSRLDEADARSTRVRSGSQDRQMKIINESGLYDLVLDSRKPEAKRFRRWVTSEVIPSIRKTGGYINPRATEDQLIALADRAAAQARVLRELRDIVDPAWLEAKARHVAARALGEEPEVVADDRPLTVGEYLGDRGISGKTLRSLSPTFGKALKRTYIERFGVQPPVVERFVDGALRMVAGYTETHRPLFDDVWRLLIPEGR